MNSEQKELTLSEIQQEALKVLIKFDSLCKEHNWSYFITYGTLLGAVRHKGFIPWDDDVDVMMPRKDFNDFSEWCEIHENDLKPFRLCSVRNVKNYPYDLSRFVNMEYKYEITDEYKTPFDIGVFVDIYPLDNYGNSYEQGLKLCKKTIHMNHLISIYCSGKSASNFFTKITRGIIHKLLNTIGGKDFPIKESEKIVQLINKSTNDSDIFVGVPSWTQGCYQFNRDWFKELIEIDFEGLKFKAPARYHDFLTSLYGDYMQLPPMEQRNPYHKYKIFKRKTDK
ncbi:MAG: LicD family protein [Treponema sp.]|nr:LicD family protein [Treponema sp.]